MTAAVVGLGAVGGSLARDLAAAGVRVVGHDVDASSVAAALEEGVLAAALDADLMGVEQAEWVVLAAPVDASPALLRRVAARLARDGARARLVSDVGSTKRSVVEAAERAGLASRFVGAHPLAGDHRSGWSASRRGLFARRPVFLCPAGGAGEEAVDEARTLWRLCGASPAVLDATVHDERMAWVSHLPQLVATTLALALRSADFAAADLGPGGRDATRLAASSPPMWTAIALDNADAIDAALGTFADRLAELRAAIARGDAPAVRRALDHARSWREDGAA